MASRAGQYHFRATSVLQPFDSVICSLCHMPSNPSHQSQRKGEEVETQQTVTISPAVWSYAKPSPVLAGAIAAVRAARASDLLQTVPEDVIARAQAGHTAAQAIVLSTYVGNVMRTDVGRGGTITGLTRERLRSMFLNEEEYTEAVRLLDLAIWVNRNRRVRTDGQDSLVGYLGQEEREAGG